MANPLTWNMIGRTDPANPDITRGENNMPIHQVQGAIKAYCHGNWFTIEADTPAERWALMIKTIEDYRIAGDGDPFSTGTGSEMAAWEAYENKVNNRLNGTPPANMTNLEWALQFCEELDSNLLLGEIGWITPDQVEQWTLAP